MQLRSIPAIISLVIVLVSVSQINLGIYLPSLPAMVQYFHTSETTIQYTFTVNMLCMGIFFLVYGILSDVLGRRSITIVGMIIFICGSIITVFSYNITCLLIGRAIQGIGIAFAGAISRACVRDVVTDTKQLLKMLSWVAIARTVTPLAAPAIGSYIQASFDWRMNFIVLLIYGVLALVAVLFLFPETYPQYKQQKFNKQIIINKFKTVLTNKTFVGATLCAAFFYAIEIIYYIISPFLLQTRLHVSVINYGWLTLLIVAGLVMGAFFSAKLAKYFAAKKQLIIGFSIILVSEIVMLILALLHWFSVATIIVPMFIIMFGNGFIYPACASMAMIPFELEAGTASSIYGAVALLIISALTLILVKVSVFNQLPFCWLLIAVTLMGIFCYYIFQDLR